MRALRQRREDIPLDVLQELERRAARLRDKQAESEAEVSLVSVAEFAIGEMQYAIPLRALRAALPLRMVTPMPLSAAHVIGILRFQGEILAALSMGALLQAKGWRRDPAVLLVVDAGDGRLIALDCEEVPKALVLPAELLEQARESKGTVQELVIPDGRVLQLVDLARLLAAPREDGLGL